MEKTTYWIFDDFEVKHYSVHRGGCLFAGEIQIKNLKTNETKHIQSSMEANKTKGMESYLKSLVKKHFPN